MGLAQSSPTMQGLLVLASLTVISAQILPYGGLGSPYGYSGLGLGYGGLGFPYSYGANVLKPVVKEIEVPVETIKFEAAATGCSNSGLGYAGLGYAGLPGLPYTALPAP